MWSPYGKIVIIKSLALSQLVSLFSVLPSLTRFLFGKELNSLLFNFIWRGKFNKKRENLNAVKKGGTNMTNAHVFMKSMKII